MNKENDLTVLENIFSCINFAEEVCDLIENRESFARILSYKGVDEKIVSFCHTIRDRSKASLEKITGMTYEDAEKIFDPSDHGNAESNCKYPWEAWQRYLGIRKFETGEN